MKSGMENLKGKNAITYTRVSTTEQKTIGNSLLSQKTKIRSFCDKYGINILKEFEEDYSAKNFERPTYKRLKKYAFENKKNIDFLICVDWDRFSRNSRLSAVEQLFYTSLSIELNCIDAWRDFSDPSSTLINAIDLALPQVDNEYRSKKIKDGIKQANREGRYVSNQPLGYLKGRDENNKPLMRPCDKLSPLIKELFTEFSDGLLSQNRILKMEKYKPLKLSRSNLNRLLKDVKYAGKLDLSDDGEEPEIIDAMHKPIISYRVFQKTQIEIEKRSRFKEKPKKYNDNLPLRGHLKCSKCGSNLTGSGSTGKMGNKYYYYHCNSRKCNERFRSELAHEKLLKYFEKFKLNEKVKNLFVEILKEQYLANENSKIELINQLTNQIQKIKSDSLVLAQKCIEGIFGDDIFKKKQVEYDRLLSEKQSELENLKGIDDNIEKFVGFSLELFSNLDRVLKYIDHEALHELMSSIFEEKLEFEDGNYRTPELNPSIKYIYQEMNKLELEKRKKGDKISNVSRLVLEAGLEPARPQWSLDFKSNVSTNSTTRAWT